MIRKIGAALAIAAGALAAAGFAAPAQAATQGDKIIDLGEVVVWKDQNFVGQFYDFGPTSPTVYPSVPSFETCSNLTGWFVNSDETTRKPEATEAGLKFEPADLIHHNVTGVTTDNISPGTFTANPAPGQDSFFSVEVINTDGTGYGTLRWNTTTSKWNMVANNGTFYENTSATAVVNAAGKSHTVVRFGVGFTLNPPGTVTTTVSAVIFNGTTYSLTCPTPSFGTAPTTTPIDNNTSSIVNYSTSTVRAYADANYTGSSILLLPYGSPTSGGNSYAYTSLGSLDNQLSSHRP
jgi:hypothetical protein